MSGGTSGGNIVTENVATYAARTWRTVVKTDAFGMVSDAQLASIIGANWFNNVDDNLAQVNAWMNGTGVASIIKAGIVESDQINLNGDIFAQNIECDSLNVGGTVLINNGDITAEDAEFSGSVGVAGRVSIGYTNGWTQAPVGATDLAVGKLEAVDHGVTIFSTAVGRLVFSDSAFAAVGYLIYTHATDKISLGISGVVELNLDATTLSPGADGGLSLGTSSLRYANAHMTAITAYSSLTVGDATGAPVINVNRDTAQQGNILFKSEGTTEAHIRHEAGYLGIGRYSAGVYQNAIQFDLSAGDVSMPRHLTLGAASATLTAGTTSGVGTLNLRGASGGAINFYNSSNQVSWGIDATSSFTLSRYVGGVSTDGITYSSTGILFPNLPVTIGNGFTTAGELNFVKVDAGTFALNWKNPSTIRWALTHDASENLLLTRHNSGGTIIGTLTFTNSNGLITGSGSLQLTDNAASIELGSGTSGATPVITLGKGATNSASIVMQNAGTTRWALIMNSSENLLFSRYDSSGVLQDSVTVSNSDGSWTFPGGIGVSGQTRRLTSGTGAPAAAATNGDIYWRIDGTISTTFYVRIGGVWTAATWT